MIVCPEKEHCPSMKRKYSLNSIFAVAIATMLMLGFDSASYELTLLDATVDPHADRAILLREHFAKMIKTKELSLFPGRLIQHPKPPQNPPASPANTTQRRKKIMVEIDSASKEKRKGGRFHKKKKKRDDDDDDDGNSNDPMEMFTVVMTLNKFLRRTQTSMSRRMISMSIADRQARSPS